MFQHDKQGAVDVISGDSPIHQSCLDALQPIVESCLVSGQPQLVLDLSQVPLIDSKGLEFLLDVHDECTRRGGVLRLAAPNAVCRDVLDLCDVSLVMEVCHDVTSAVGGFAR